MYPTFFTAGRGYPQMLILLHVFCPSASLVAVALLAAATVTRPLVYYDVTEQQSWPKVCPNLKMNLWWIINIYRRRQVF